MTSDLLNSVRTRRARGRRASCEFAGGEIPAAASWVPREGQARVIHLPTPRTT